MSIGREDYQDRKDARMDRLEAARDKQARLSDAEFRRSQDLVKDIPLGQPNIIGRPGLPNLRAKSARAFERSMEASKRADYYAQRAQAAANNTAISSDDPDALSKLEDKLAGLMEAQERDKARNAHYRKHRTLKGCPGLSDEEAAKIDKRIADGPAYLDCPAPSFILSNRNGEISRLKKRIAALRRVDSMEHVEISFDGGRIVTNEEINRVQIIFDGKPDEATRRELKSWGFRWAPSEGAWQAQRTPEALARAKRLCHVDG